MDEEGRRRQRREKSFMPLVTKTEVKLKALAWPEDVRAVDRWLF